MNRASLRFAAAAALLGALAGIGLDRALIAQQTAVTRTVLATTPSPGGATHDVILTSVVLQPGATTGKHRHPGVEVGYVVEGEITLTQDGGATLIAGPGAEFVNTAPHEARNTGSAPARLLVTFVVERGKPLAEPVP
jgi:quercetin dioxygenase-like cupin family protein